MNNIEVVAVLNGLIKTCKDVEESYIIWLSDSRRRPTELTELFLGRQLSYSAALSELQDLVLLEDGDPETTGTVVAAIHRGLTTVKAAVLGMDDVEVLNEVGLAEDQAVKAYCKAFENELPAHIRSVLDMQYRSLLYCRKMIRSLCDQFKSSELVVLRS
jgi:uncharacterized protein (TIGR02284 family)